MPRSPGMRPLCHLSWAAPPPPRPRPVAGAWKAGEGTGTGEGTRGGQGQHHTFPQVSVSGRQGTLRCGRGSSSQYRLAPSSQTLQPHRAPRTPRPALCLHLLSPLRHPQSEAIRHLRDPQPVEHPSRGLRCHACVLLIDCLGSCFQSKFLEIWFPGTSMGFMRLGKKLIGF